MQQPSSTSPQGFSISRETIKIILIVLVVVIIDQITKFLIVTFIPLYRESGYIMPVLGDFFRLVHVKNSAVAFSLGKNSIPPILRRWLLIILPLGILIWYTYVLVKDEDMKGARGWGGSLIIGGGLGNLLDRIFRGGEVVDFLDVKFYGLLGWERWPTFNVADSAISIGVILFFVGLIIKRKRHE